MIVPIKIMHVRPSITCLQFLSGYREREREIRVNSNPTEYELMVENCK